MKFCVIIINDGRNDYLEQSLKSFKENVVFPEGSKVYKILIDDWPQERDEEAIKKIAKKYKIDKVVLNEENLGVNRNVKKVWNLVPEDVDYIWHQENDFTYLEKVSIETLMRVLENPTIIQCALLRQAWFEDELHFGTLMKTRPERWRSANVGGIDIVLHKDHFTFNPSLYKRKWLVDLEPFGEYDLRNYYMAKHPGFYFSYLGTKEDKHRVLHIGERKR
jgi:GT2 family glycosyltransferase